MVGIHSCYPLLVLNCGIQRAFYVRAAYLWSPKVQVGYYECTVHNELFNAFCKLQPQSFTNRYSHISLMAGLENLELDHNLNIPILINYRHYLTFYQNYIKYSDHSKIERILHFTIVQELFWQILGFQLSINYQDRISPYNIYTISTR